MTGFRVRTTSMVQNSCRTVNRILKHPIFVTGLLVTGLVLGVRQVGGLQPWELLAYDQMIRLRPATPPDPRLLIVSITEGDIQQQHHWPICDGVMAELLERLQQYQPRVIGIDIYRNVPVPCEPIFSKFPKQTSATKPLLKQQTQAAEYNSLMQQLAAKNMVSVTLLGDEQSDNVAAPARISADQIGFSDIVLDPDAVVRRNFLYAKSGDQRLYSFALRLSLKYLEHPNNQPFQVKNTALQINDRLFPSLDSSFGGYQLLDDRGYQVMLNYRPSEPIAQHVTLTQVLNGELKPEWITDRLVIVGTTAPSTKDLFSTPYNLSSNTSPQMAGVIVHAHMVSQLISTVLDERPLIWSWSNGWEALWLGAWAMVGGVVAWRSRHPLMLGLSGLAGVSTLFVVCLLTFNSAGWIPFVPALITFIGAEIGVIVYRLVYDALHDTLTGLPNRALFTRQLQWALEQRDRRLKRSKQVDQSLLAVLLFGLDSFKSINDTFGHRFGDQLLVVTTRRLKSCLRAVDQLARVGGDEFAILLYEPRDVDEVTYLADQLQRQVTQPFALNGQEVFTTASVGIVLNRPGADCHSDDLLRDAHTAMNRAKASGKARHEVFVTGMRMQVVNRMQLETDLRRALEREELCLHYQPLISLHTGCIAGFEALVRWQHPQRGLVHPVEFIPIAEETDLILPIGQWVLWEACRQLRQWQEQFAVTPPLIVSVNLSAKQFAQPNLLEQIQQTLDTTGLDGHSLKLEITESIAMTDVEATIALLLRLKALNLQLSIDDFGTGYSSLSYLHRLPTDTIKVDRSFVSRMGDTSEDAHIVQTIIMLGHNLGMNIVAEGVETGEQLLQLRSLSCEYAQGYFFSKPVSSEAAEALIKADPRW